MLRSQRCDASTIFCIQHWHDDNHFQPPTLGGLSEKLCLLSTIEKLNAVESCCFKINLSLVSDIVSLLVAKMYYSGLQKHVLGYYCVALTEQVTVMLHNLSGLQNLSCNAVLSSSRRKYFFVECRVFSLSSIGSPGTIASFKSNIRRTQSLSR